MASINSYKISDIYWRPVDFNIIGNQFKTKSFPITFSNGMSFYIHEIFSNLTDVSYNNKNGIFLTNLKQNNDILEDNNSPNNVNELTIIESPLADTNGFIYRNKNQVLNNTKNKNFSISDKLKFIFKDSKVSIENNEGFYLTKIGIGNNQLIFKSKITPTDSSQVFDYFLNEDIITLFDSTSNFTNIITKNNYAENLMVYPIDPANQILPRDAFLSLPSISNKNKTYESVKNSFVVKYESNPLISQKDLKINSKDETYKQNYLGIIPFENYKSYDDHIEYDLYIHGLKNYQTTEYNYNNENLNRIYTKIYSGTNQNKGLENIHLGYQTSAIKIEFKPNITTSFYYTPTTNIISLSSAGFIESGAVAGEYAYISDRIFTSYKDNFDFINTDPSNLSSNRFLCSWLSGSKDGDKIWKDRYYNSAYYTLDQALSSTNIVYHDKIDPSKPYVYDIDSTTQLKAGVLYEYHHTGIEDSKKFLEFLNYSHDYINNKTTYSNILSITNWISSTLIDNSTYNNNGLVYDNNISNFKGNYWNLDGSNYAIFPAKTTLLQNKKLTTSLWLNVKDWSNIEGYQIFGNYYNSGFGFINESKAFSPIITIVNNANKTIYNFNYKFGQLSNVQIPLTTTNQKYSIIQRLDDYSYWIFDSNNLKALKYTVDDKLILTKNVNIIISNIDQVEIDSNQNFYLYDNINKKYLKIDSNGDIISNGSVSSVTNRIEIDLNNNLIEIYGNTSVIDNDNILWEIIGENLYQSLYDINDLARRKRNVYATVGSCKQISCDQYNNLWFLLENGEYSKMDINRNFVFKRKFSTSINTENNCDLQSQNVSPTRNINFISSSQNLTTFCGLSALENDQLILVDKEINEAYIIDQFGEPVTKLSFKGLINHDDSLDFYSFGDFTGYQNLRKFKIKQNKLSWNFKIADPNGINSPQLLSLKYGVSALPKGWHHFAFSFDSIKGLAQYYVDSILVDTVTFTPNTYELYYDYKTSLLLGSTTVKNTILNNLLSINDGYRFIGSIAELRMYNIYLNKGDIEQLYLSSDFSPNINSLKWDMNIGTRNYIEEIKHWFQFQLPSSKSKYYNINLRNLNVNDDIKSSIELAIKNIITKISPSYTELYKINWK
jgi:hypothetical protein